MSSVTPNVILRTSPHFRSSNRVDVIMRNVVYALLPVCAFSFYQFGISVLALLLTCTLSCMLTEHLICRWSDKPGSLHDWSVVITGLLMGLVLPPGFPLWMAVVASVFGVAVGKMFFGGLGFNVMNPALVGRAFAQAAFTVPATTWTPFMADNRFTEFIPSTLTTPFLKPQGLGEWIAQVAPDGFSGATPLALMKFEKLETDPVHLLLGTTAGSSGETSALLILLCGLYLALRRMLDWRIPAGILLSAAITSAALHSFDQHAFPSVAFTLCSGGLMLGAVFMATDMVSSPVTPAGTWIYAGLIGFVTVIIRLFGGLNEGVMYAILLGNACSPLIASFTQPRIYGAKPAKSAS